MANGDKKEAKRMKKVFELVAKGYAANKTQIDALRLFGPGKKIKAGFKGAKLVKDIALNPTSRKKALEAVKGYMKKNKDKTANLMRVQTREELKEQAGKAIVTGGAGSVYVDRQMQKNKSKNKTKPKKKKKFKSQY